MVRILINQFGYLAIWGITFAGGLIFLRRGRTHGALSVLFGSAILLLIDAFYIAIMFLTRTRVMEAMAGAKMYQVVWVPQLLGGFLFAFGFLQLARASRSEG